MMNASDLKIRVLMDRGKYEEAQALLRARLAAEPNDSDLHLMLAQCLMFRGRPKEAEASAKTAIGLDPDSGFPHEVLARILLESSNLKAAEEAIRQAGAIDGDCPSHRALLARIASERGDFQNCIDHAEAGLAMDPDDDSCRFFRGIALSRLGRHEEADETALGLLRDDPEDSANHSARGWILLERNDTDSAVRHFQEALRLDPTNEDARIGLAESLQQGNPVLGGFLRALIAMERMSLMKLLVVALLAGIVIPRVLTADGMPPAAAITGHWLKVVVMSFCFLAVAAVAMSATLLFASRRGRHALARQETRAVKWCVVPLLGGLVLMGLWIAGGAKHLPLAAIGMLSAASLLYVGFSQRHPWVRRRMVAVAGLAFAAAMWLLLGPVWVFVPMIEDMVSTAVQERGAPSSGESHKAQIAYILRVKKWAFTYPALALLLLASYSSDLASALLRRAPDEAD